MILVDHHTPPLKHFVMVDKSTKNEVLLTVLYAVQSIESSLWSTGDWYMERGAAWIGIIKIFFLFYYCLRCGRGEGSDMFTFLEEEGVARLASSVLIPVARQGTGVFGEVSAFSNRKLLTFSCSGGEPSSGS
ncbi:hypothetical protein QAD02_021652 [Eretmocerus hayati]|uniref:Uncharacterized protein n=1 Tax=Eretmocerus hayati TaxID=131215 RepID=A0ACC2PRB7_9HYME|nr:hypothetical protein QAD02_021652 [Eretmocerus hayati]